MKSQVELRNIAAARGFENVAAMRRSMSKRDAELATEIKQAKGAKAKDRLRGIRRVNESEFNSFFG